MILSTNCHAGSLPIAGLIWSAQIGFWESTSRRCSSPAFLAQTEEARRSCSQSKWLFQPPTRARVLAPHSARPPNCRQEVGNQLNAINKLPRRSFRRGVGNPKCFCPQLRCRMVQLGNSEADVRVPELTVRKPTTSDLKSPNRLQS